MSHIQTNRSKSVAAMPVAAAFILVLFSLIFTQEASACAACGCLVSKDWQAQGISSEPGWTVGLTYDYIKQDRQSIGRDTSSTTIQLLNNNPNASEVEQLTTTAITTLNVNYNSTDWGVDLQLPYVARYHETYNPAFNTSQSNTIGDARVLGRFSGSEDGSFGVILGVKLPTGPIDATFSDGITPLDRSLQPGTGSSDFIMGVYKSGQVAKYGWFVQGMYQTALATKSDTNNGGDYKPGDSKSLNVGIRYATFGQRIVPMLQLNMISRLADSGTAATPLLTGGDLVYLTPGISARIWGGTTAFAFLQVPLYQNVNASDPNGALGTGSQLTPQRILSFGIRHSF